MVWLQNLAGHAENWLTEIDQNAATVLKEMPIQEKHAELRIGTYNLKRCESEVQLPRVDINSYGISLEVISEKQTLIKENVSDDNYLDESSKIANKSNQISPLSSFSKSFFIAEESRLLNEKQVLLEIKNQDLNDQLLNMEDLYSELKKENDDLQLQIERCNEKVAQLQLEKEQYTARAQRVLQEKERLIASKEQSSFDTGEQSVRYEIENEELKIELQFCQESNNELSQKNNELMEQVESLKTIETNLNKSKRNLEKILKKEKNQRRAAEEDCSAKSDELYFKNEELCELQTSLQSKKSEVAKLKELLAQRSSINIDDDVKSRIKLLTQTLMLEQNNLEAVVAEKNTLKLQLEKLENKYEKKIKACQNYRCHEKDESDETTTPPPEILTNFDELNPTSDPDTTTDPNSENIDPKKIKTTPTKYSEQLELVEELEPTAEPEHEEEEPIIKHQGVYYIYHPNGILQQVVFETRDDPIHNQYLALVNYQDIGQVVDPVYAHDPDHLIFHQLNKK